MNERSDFASVDLRHLGEVPFCSVRVRHKLRMRAEVSQSDDGVLDCIVVIQVGINLNGAKHVNSNLLLNQFIHVILEITQVREISTTLSMIFNVFGVSEHIHHETHRLITCYGLITMKQLCHMGKGSCCI